MELQFDGFQTTLPVFWIIAGILVLLVLSFWTYRHIEGLPTAWRWTLISLRSLAFFILILILLNPVIAIRDEVTSPVRIALLLDNSQSTTIKKGNYDGEETYNKIIEESIVEPSDRFENLEIEPYGFDRELFELESPFDLNLEGSQTDIDRALVDFMDIMDQQEAVIMLTDGIVTSGRNPSASASRLPVPIYTVGIGDTTRRNDIVVQRVSHIPTVSLNSRIPIEASILNDGFPDQDIDVQLRQDDQILQDTIIRSSETRSVQQVEFELLLEEEGLQQYQIHVPEQEGEWTAENNTRHFSVDVRDDRLRILHLAYEIHPDVRNIRRFLREDKQISLENRTWISDDRFIEGDLPDRPDTLDLVILHGFPHQDLDDAHAGQTSGRFEDNALFIIGSPGQDVTRLSSLFPGRMPLGFDSAFSWHNVQIHMPEAVSNHTIMDLDLPGDLRMPNVRGGIQHVRKNENAVSLLHSVYRDNITETPFLAIRTLGDRNISQLNSYNFYRWSLSTDEDTRNFWDDLLNNIVKWTATPPDEELLELTPSDPVFQIGEPVIMDAFLRNESGEPEEGAVIDLEIENNGDDERRYVMSNEGGGRYQLEIENLPEGSYTYQGIASRGDREIDTRSGHFSVGGVNREFLNTVRDEPLLELMAHSSGGSYIPHENSGQLLTILEEELGFEKRVETVIQSLALHRHPFWFILVILLLTAEWVIRKYRALA